MNRQIVAIGCVIVGAWLAVTILLAGVGTIDHHTSMTESFLNVLPWTALLAVATGIIAAGIWLGEPE